MGHLSVNDFFDLADSKDGVYNLFAYGFDMMWLADDVPEEFRSLVNYMNNLSQALDEAGYDLESWDVNR